MNSSITSLLLIFGLWLTGAVLCCAGGNEYNKRVSAPTSTQEITPEHISAAQLTAEYEANEIDADRKYKNRILIVSGKVVHVGKDIINNMYVTISGEKEFGIVSAQCMFDDDWVIRLSNLREGDNVTVQGRCDGKFGNVLLRDCSFP
jgi:hypothetical protein